MKSLVKEVTNVIEGKNQEFFSEEEEKAELSIKLLMVCFE